MTVLAFIKIFSFMFLANSVVYAGIFFINGALLPELLASLYSKTSYVMRVIICLVTFLTAGNILFAKAFEWFDPVLVAPLNIIAFVFLQVIIAILVNKVAPSLMIIPALAVVTAGSYWVYTILDSSKL